MDARNNKIPMIQVRSTLGDLLDVSNTRVFLLEELNGDQRVVTEDPRSG